MSLLLHLSDLHLASIDKDPLPDDHKWDIVPVKDRPSQQGMLRDTLAQLGQQLVAQEKTLDGIVVSGDITVTNEENGFQKFDEVLGWLGKARPAPEKIVVVPGNHDVEWGATDAVARYRHFTKYIRDKGFITPFLEDIDLKDGRSPASFDKRYLLDPSGNWAIVPINSSHYCGRVEPLKGIPDGAWSRLPDMLAGAGVNRDEAEKALRHLRMQDVARISTEQLNVIRDVAARIREQTASAGTPPLLIGVLHHQLLPVSIREEFKPFETITNLGHFRYALRDNGFSVVLHGHKHTEYALYDYIHRLPEADVNSPHRVLVVSANAAKVTGTRPEVIGRLIEIPDTRDHSTVAISNIPAVEAGTNLQIHAAKYFAVWQPFATGASAPARPEVVEGDSVDQVYERALSVFSGLSPDSSVPNLICRVTKPRHPVQLPATYPEIPGVDDRSQWFTTLVEWWQKADFKRLSGSHHFNHGHRIYAYALKVNQIAGVAGVIASSHLTSRAVVSLLRPGVDDVNSDKQFPSFCFVQFVVRDLGTVCSLEAVAYFRKQEIKYWWPLNIAELSRLQNEVFERVKEGVKEKARKSLICGPITTVAAIAARGEDLPKILVPALDVDLEQDSQKLWDMIYALCSPEVRSKGDYVKVWATVLNSLVPPVKQNPSGVPVPVQSVEYLADISSHFAAHHNDALKQLSEYWSALARTNATHAQKMNKEKLGDEEHSHWRNDVLSKLNEIRKVINQAFSAHIPELH